MCLSTIQHEDRFHFVKALNAKAVKAGYRLMVFNACSDLFEEDRVDNAGEKALFELIPYDMLEAMIVFPAFIYDTELIMHIVAKCHEYDLPVISIDKHIEGCINYSFSYADTFERLVSHLIEDHGARNIWHMAGMKENEFSQERVRAFRYAMEQHGIECSDDMIGYGDFWEEPTVNTLHRWFFEEKRELPDAIVAANDSMAITISNFLQQKMDLKIPRDIIVTGFDGIIESEYHVPQLTTCRQDYDAMGELIIDTVGRIGRGEPYSKEQSIDFTIIRAQSCGCMPLKVDNVNETVQKLTRRMNLASKRQEMMCGIQSSVTAMSNLEDLPGILDDWYMFHTICFALSDEAFRGPDYEVSSGDGRTLSGMMRAIYQNYKWERRQPCVLPLSSLSPGFNIMLEQELPMIVTVVHFLDLPLGYCISQPEIEIDEYEKLHTFMITIDSAIGIFHSQLRIKAINQRLRSVNDELERLYIHDYLTGLFNRRGFYKEMSRKLANNTNKSNVVFFISADLDGLKYINDTYGHIEGDAAISAVGRALVASAQDDEICARFGGDEFTVAAIEPKDKRSGYYGEFKRRFEQYLESYNSRADKQYRVEASIGCYSRSISENFEMDDMIKNSDNSMYANKMARKKQRQ